MTTKEFYTAIINNEDLPAEIKEKAATLLDSLNKNSEKRSSKPSKKREENAPIMEAIFRYVATNGPQIASAIGEALNISTNKASALCRQLVEEGKLDAEEVKIPKKGKCKQYSVAGTTAQTEDEPNEE